MGYTTYFDGSFQVSPALDKSTRDLINGLCKTRRMKRDLKELSKIHHITLSEAQEKWGDEGQFYYNVSDFENYGQSKDPSIVDFNIPPKDQPSLWLGWQYDETTQEISSNGIEKFYNYDDWIKYLITKILEPRGYTVSGTVTWHGEDYEDLGKIEIKENIVTILIGKIIYVKS